MISAIDLFCGVGGLTHRLSRGGVRVVAGVDIDPECRFAFETNNSADVIERDIRTIRAKELLDLWGPSNFYLLAGCAPCQPFSTYSQPINAAKNDQKWNLIRDFARLIRETTPDFVTMENVPRLLQHDYQFLPKNEPVRFNILGRLIGNAVPVKIGEIVGMTFIEHSRKFREVLI